MTLNSNTSLIETPEGLTLVHDGMHLQGDFTRMIPRLRQANLERELLIKAARIKGVDHPFAIDATAGLGEDALLLAAAGYTVHLYERDETIAALLEDALNRAMRVPELADAVSRMTLHQENSIDALNEIAEAARNNPSTPLPDVVHLDPMFPARRKSASVKKKPQLLQFLEAPCEDEAELLDAALAANPRKIVIKRPLKGALLAGKKPSYSIKGKAIRYDVIALPR